MGKSIFVLLLRRHEQEQHIFAPAHVFLTQKNVLAHVFLIKNCSCSCLLNKKTCFVLVHVFFKNAFVHVFLKFALVHVLKTVALVHVFLTKNAFVHIFLDIIL